MNVAVFCSSKANLSEDVFSQAQSFSRKLVESKMGLVYGGASVGLMGYFADQVLKLEGKVIGVMPEKIFDHEIAHQGLTELIYTPDMMDRKKKMMELSSAFVMFPGGLGTMDEAIEVITWKSIYKTDKPIIFFNWQGFWNPFLEMLKSYEKTGLFYPETMKSFTVVESITEMFNALEKAK